MDGYAAPQYSHTAHLRSQVQAHAHAPSLHVVSGYAPVAPAIVEQLVDTPHIARNAVEPMRDPVMWTLVKHVALLAFVVMALFVVLYGEGSLMMAGTYAGTAFLTIVTFVVADRVRFLATYGNPMDMPLAEHAPVATSGYGPVMGYDPTPMVPLTQLTHYPAPAPKTFQVSVT